MCRASWLGWQPWPVYSIPVYLIGVPNEKGPGSPNDACRAGADLQFMTPLFSFFVFPLLYGLVMHGKGASGDKHLA